MIWEAEFLIWLQGLRSPVMDKIMAILSSIGNAGLFWIVLAVIFLCFAKSRPTGFQMALALIMTFIIGNLILKHLVDRIRPYDMYEAIEALVIKPSDSSFPSGHASCAFAGATAIYLNNKKVGIAAFILAAAIAFSRLYNQVHYPTDVLAGAFIGVICGILANVIYRKLAEKKTVQNV